MRSPPCKLYRRNLCYSSNARRDNSDYKILQKVSTQFVGALAATSSCPLASRECQSQKHPGAIPRYLSQLIMMWRCRASKKLSALSTIRRFVLLRFTRARIGLLNKTRRRCRINCAMANMANGRSLRQPYERRVECARNLRHEKRQGFVTWDFAPGTHAAAVFSASSLAVSRQ